MERPNLVPSGEEPEAPQGVVGEQGVSQQEMTQQPGGDAEQLRQQIEELQTKLNAAEEARELDIRNLKSSLDKRYAQDMRERERQLEDAENRYHEMATRGMDEQEKLAYERDVLAERYAKQQRELDRLRQQNEVSQNMGNYLRGFAELGVPIEELDTSSPEALMASGWEGVAKARAAANARIRELEAKVNNPSGQQGLMQQPPAQPRTAPNVVTGASQQTPKPKSLDDIIAAFKAKNPNLTDEQFFRALESGQLDPQIIADMGRE